MDAAHVLSGVFEFDANYRPGAAQSQAFGPFDDGDARLGENVVERDRFQIVSAFQAVKINVIYPGWRRTLRFENVDEIECGAGDVFFARRAKSADDSLGQSCFSRAQIAFQ